MGSEEAIFYGGVQRTDMDVREATIDDIETIRSIATRSLEESYSAFLDSETIETAVEQWYGDDSGLEDELEDEHSVFRVIVDGGTVVAFSQSQLIGEAHSTGRIQWIHVDPDHRGQGLGPRLLVRTREALFDAGADQLQSVVLADNEFGNEFYRGHGFEQVDARDLEIGEETYTEHVYVETERDVDDEWRAQEAVSDGETTCYVSYGEPARGSTSPFYAAYADEDATDRYGWYCGNCDSLDNAMDSMGRIVCNNCGNRRKATRWDAAYL